MLRVASAEIANVGSRPNEKTFLAALYAEQCRTNDLLEQLLTERSASAE